MNTYFMKRGIEAGLDGSIQDLVNPPQILDHEVSYFIMMIVSSGGNGSEVVAAGLSKDDLIKLLMKFEKKLDSRR